MVSLLVVFQEALHAATIMPTSEIIARALTMGRNERNVVYGIASLLVARREVPHVATVLISEIIARVLTRGMIEPTVVYGTAGLLVAFQEVLHVATMLIFEIIAQALNMGRTIVSAQRQMARYFVGKWVFLQLFL